MPWKQTKACVHDHVVPSRGKRVCCEESLSETELYERSHTFHFNHSIEGRWEGKLYTSWNVNIHAHGTMQLVETFLTETVDLEGELSSGNADCTQLYIGIFSCHIHLLLYTLPLSDVTTHHAASFWGISDVVMSLLDRGADVNHSNKVTLWTPLHAATFQEHGKVK